MNVYRISRLRWIDRREGSGVPGRWNYRYSKVLYTSSSISLARLEILVHIQPDQIPDDYHWIKGEIPDHLPIDTVGGLPEDTAGYGTMWVNSARRAILAVPSVIVPEKNYLLNPAHEDFRSIRWLAPQKLVIDPRLTGIKPSLTLAAPLPETSAVQGA